MIRYFFDSKGKFQGTSQGTWDILLGLLFLLGPIAEFLVWSLAMPIITIGCAIHTSRAKKNGVKLRSSVINLNSFQGILFHLLLNAGWVLFWILVIGS